MPKKTTSRDGQALIEFALVLPLLFLLIVNVVNFGGLFYAFITISNAVRSGAQYMTMGPVYAGYQALPDPTLVQNLVKTELATLPHATDPKTIVNVCSNDQSSSTAKAQAPETCLPPNNPATGAAFKDPEPGTSVVGTVEVKYTFCPFIPFWEFPALHIHSTLPSCTVSSGNITAGGTAIRRVSVMRMVQ